MFSNSNKAKVVVLLLFAIPSMLGFAVNFSVKCQPKHVRVFCNPILSINIRIKSCGYIELIIYFFTKTELHCDEVSGFLIEGRIDCRY